MKIDRATKPILVNVTFVHATDWTGDALRKARSRKGQSLRTFAKRVGLSSSYYSKLERGEATPDVETLACIVKALTGSRRAFDEAIRTQIRKSMTGKLPKGYEN